MLDVHRLVQPGFRAELVGRYRPVLQEVAKQGNTLACPASSVNHFRHAGEGDLVDDDVVVLTLMQLRSHPQTGERGRDDASLADDLALGMPGFLAHPRDDLIVLVLQHGDFLACALGALPEFRNAGEFAWQILLMRPGHWLQLVGRWLWLATGSRDSGFEVRRRR